jgi:hypothetical protein
VEAKVWCKLIIGTVPSAARVVLQQQTVVVVWLPQDVHGVCKVVGAGARAVQLTASLAVLHSRQPGLGWGMASIRCH